MAGALTIRLGRFVLRSFMFVSCSVGNTVASSLLIFPFLAARETNVGIKLSSGICPSSGISSWSRPGCSGYNVAVSRAIARTGSRMIEASISMTLLRSFGWSCILVAHSDISMPKALASPTSNSCCWFISPLPPPAPNSAISTPSCRLMMGVIRTKASHSQLICPYLRGANLPFLDTSQPVPCSHEWSRV
jgi:hypothetical protein